MWFRKSWNKHFRQTLRYEFIIVLLDFFKWKTKMFELFVIEFFSSLIFALALYEGDWGCIFEYFSFLIADDSSFWISPIDQNYHDWDFFGNHWIGFLFGGWGSRSLEILEFLVFIDDPLMSSLYAKKLTVHPNELHGDVDARDGRTRLQTCPFNLVCTKTSKRLWITFLLVISKFEFALW